MKKETLEADFGFLAAREIFEDWLMQIGIDIETNESDWIVSSMLEAAGKNPFVNPWQRAIDDELVCAHLGVAKDTTLPEAKKALNELIQWHIDVATNPQVNGGLSLQPEVEAEPVAKPPGIEALMCVISSLRDTGHISDEEGELTNDLRALRDWAQFQRTAPQAELMAIGYPHEQMDALALAHYKVVPSDQSMFWRHAVVAGDGQRHLYNGSEVDCQNMARKFAGAFLDGAFAFHATQQTQAEVQAEPVAKVLGWVRKKNGEIGSHFFTYEPHCDCSVRDNGGEKIAVTAATAPQAQPKVLNTEVLGWVRQREDGTIGNHFFTYEPHCDCSVKDNGGKKVAVVALKD